MRLFKYTYLLAAAISIHLGVTQNVPVALWLSLTVACVSLFTAWAIIGWQQESIAMLRARIERFGGK